LFDVADDMSFLLSFLCIISCLNDAELELLGVPWDTYSQAAAANGLDIVR